MERKLEVVRGLGGWVFAVMHEDCSLALWFLLPPTIIGGVAVGLAAYGEGVAASDTVLALTLIPSVIVTARLATEIWLTRRRDARFKARSTAALRREHFERLAGLLGGVADHERSEITSSLSGLAWSLRYESLGVGCSELVVRTNVVLPAFGACCVQGRPPGVADVEVPEEVLSLVRDRGTARDMNGIQVFSDADLRWEDVVRQLRGLRPGIECLTSHERELRVWITALFPEEYPGLVEESVRLAFALDVPIGTPYR